MTDIKFGILKGFCGEYRYYARSCEHLNFDYEIIDFTAPDWMERIRNSGCRGFLCRPPSKVQERKAMFDERLFIMTRHMGKLVYPSYEELLIYENKRLAQYWLEAHGFPHPETFVFYRKRDLNRFLENYRDFPLIYKTNIGAKSSGVKVLKTASRAKRVGRKIFGIFPTPSLTRGYTPVRSGRILRVPAPGVRERHVMLLQKFEGIRWEWRMVRIGGSYFGHRKLPGKKGLSSGTLRKGWGAPPVELLRLTRDICDTGGFNSMAIDIFETEDGRYLVNELQSIFGQSTENLMYVDGEPGRYIEKDGDFIFQPGEFNLHNSFMLRVIHFADILRGIR